MTGLPTQAPGRDAARLLAGAAERQSDFEAAVAALDGGEVLWLRQRTERRRVARSRLPDGTPCLVKHFLAPTRHKLRERLKRLIGQDGARREWRALLRLREAGLGVPRPLAHLRLASGEDALIMEWIEGPALGEALEAAPAARRRLLEQVGARVQRLHEAGWAHRDLHRGNLIVSASGPMLVDVQAAVPRISARARHRDLGMLDHSLRGRLGIGDRLRLRSACLGLAPPFDASARQALRSVGAASDLRRRFFLRSRALRSLRSGRRARALRLEGGAGLIARDADEAQVRAALTAEVAPDGIDVRRHAPDWRDLWRGSAARHGWQNSFAVAAAGLPCAEPLAFVEWRRFGRPGPSALLLRAPRPGAADPPLDARILAGARLWARLHAAGFRTAPPQDRGFQFQRKGDQLEARLAMPETLGLPQRSNRTDPQRALAELEQAWRAQGADAGLCQRGRDAYRAARRCG